ncbi:hypothetical protein [Massilia antarctica]|uniref:hypothetical protein n=1 Tax=Massilia antarctica TaxID=2765360 RepID=UPI0006BB7EDF|nr:hypothetical protein [Massilia sp. H27-R4]MCY0914224.1 hypothetical protein [Massilia sp. H27-R4]CUI08634.1 hypothetical protein BN2497_12045 [Janthinobacterium sp. CG23_2]CUU32420.1 hypothetical protein BN3177_12045 [Janthinobacterium sp. CG23_2]
MSNTHYMRLACAMVAVAAGLMAPAVACAGTYKLECTGPGKEKFLLKKNYEEYLWGAAPLRRYPSSTERDRNWQIRFQGRWFNKIEVPGYLKFTAKDTAPCHQMGVIDGVPVVDKSYLKSDGSWFDSAALPTQFAPGEFETSDPALHQRILALHARVSDGHGFLVPRRGRLVYEVALSSVADRSPDGNVVAVVQSTSTDNGKTWTALAVSTDAQIYELGKSIKAQSFVARQSGARTVQPRS